MEKIFEILKSLFESINRAWNHLISGINSEKELTVFFVHVFFMIAFYYAVLLVIWIFVQIRKCWNNIIEWGIRESHKNT